MIQPPFEVENYFFPHIEVSADANFDSKAPLIPPAFDVKASVTKDEQSGVYQVALEIRLEPESDEKRQPYSLKLIGIGLFRFVKSVPDPEKLLRINGASIIYSAAREFVLTVTARGPWGAIMLPTCSFHEETKKEPQPDKEVTSKRTSAKQKKITTS